MKSLGILAVLAVLTVGAAAAQSSQDLGNVKTAGATFAEGIVQASSSTSLSIEKEGGSRLTFLVDAHTVNAANHAVGSRVKINFHTNQNGVAIADEVQGPGDTSKTDTTKTMAPAAPMTTSSSTYGATPAPAPMAAPAPSTYTTPEPTTATEPTPPMHPMAAPVDATVNTAPRTRLPKTASPLAAIGLIGLAALAGFAVLRSVR